MNNGKIKAADVEYYTNGGCTPDESEMVMHPLQRAHGPHFIYQVQHRIDDQSYFCFNSGDRLYRAEV